MRNVCFYIITFLGRAAFHTFVRKVSFEEMFPGVRHENFQDFEFLIFQVRMDLEPQESSQEERFSTKSEKKSALPGSLARPTSACQCTDSAPAVLPVQKGFCHIIIRSGIQTGNLVFYIIGQCSEHDNGGGKSVCPEVLLPLQNRFPGSDIQYNHII